MLKRQWIVEGYRGTEQFWSRAIPYSSYSERRIEMLLTYLVAKYGLNDDELLASLARPNARMAAEHLSVTGSGNQPPWSMSCGDNPMFTARVEAIG